MESAGKRLLIGLLALLVAVAGVLSFLSYSNTIYQRGVQDAVDHFNKTQATLEAHDKGDHEHGFGSHDGSPARAYSPGGVDASYMNPYDHGICDNTLNGREAISIAYSRGAQDARFAHDNDGAGGSCNWNNLPFRGAFHQACHYDLGGCGQQSVHRKGKKKAAA